MELIHCAIKAPLLGTDYCSYVELIFPRSAEPTPAQSLFFYFPVNSINNPIHLCKAEAGPGLP